MRVVSLGFALPDPRVDNHSIANAPALFEYDACLFDPAAVARQVEEIAGGAGASSGGAYQTAAGSPVLPGASGAFHYGLGELLEQRRREAQLLLERGGVIVVFGQPNAPHPSVATLPGADRYTILPAAPGVVYRAPQLLAGAGGGQIAPLDRGHPFAPYLDDLAGRLRFQAWWDVNAIADFESVGQVLARSQGGAAVAVEFRVLAGRVVFLPPPNSEPRGAARRNVTEALLESMLRSLEAPEGEEPPSWLRHYDLPGMRDARTTMERAELAAAESEARLAEARAALADASRYQGLLWREGRYAFAPLARDAFRALGFVVTPDLREPAELADGEEVALLEVDASAHTVKESSYFRLQRRIEDEFMRSGVRRKGVIAINGERLQDPKDRGVALSETLVNACENFGYALITGDSLFSLVSYALEGADADTLASIRQTILDAEGLLAIDEGEEATEEAGSDDEVPDDAAPDDAAPDDAAPDDAAAVEGSEPAGEPEGELAGEPEGEVGATAEATAAVEAASAVAGAPVAAAPEPAARGGPNGSDGSETAPERPVAVAAEEGESS